MKNGRIFTPQPVAMARVPLRPAAAQQTEQTEQDSGLLSEGIFFASRSVARAIDSPHNGSSARAAATVRAYDIRSRARTTPHGVFTAVAPARFGPQVPALHLGSGHRTVTSPSPDWLAKVSDRLLDETGLPPRLTLTSNNLVIQRGDRLEVEHPAPAGTARRSSVRATEVSVWLLGACKHGRVAATILAELARRHPAVSDAAREAAVKQMITSGLVLTDLLPADPRDDPLGHLLDKVPPSAGMRPALEQLRDLLMRADAHRPGTQQRRELLEAARHIADEVLEVDRPLTVETIADAALTLPHTVGEQAAQAASVLWRVGQLASPAAKYHERFLTAYGQYRMVPLLEVVNPVRGIGPPWAIDEVGATSDIEPRRAARLARLLAQAIGRGDREVTVDDALIEQLAHNSPASPPRTAEIHVRLLRHATGEPGLAVCPDAGSQDAGSAPGRWARWLPQLAPDEPSTVDDKSPLIAEIICRPRTARTGALAVETGFAPYRIPLGVPARDGDLTPDDLLITTNGRHLLVWSARNDRQVIPVLYSRLAPDLLPNAARALHLIGHAGTRPWHTWSWGPAGHAPYTPRVRYRNIVLAPGRWTLPEDVTGSAADRRAWDKALAAWRVDAVPAPPDVVVVQETDRKLPLDLRDEQQRELLRRCVHRGARAVTEPLGGPGAQEATLAGPGGNGHLFELVVALTRCQEPAPARPDPRAAVRAPGTGRHLPGGEWLSAALAVPARLQDAVLHRLAGFLDEAAGSVDRWFWLRYDTAALGPHLRIRFHGRPEDLSSQIQPRLAAFATDLEEQKLCGALYLEPYEQETERYGGHAAITAAEQVFAADSTLALLALAHTDSNDRLLLAAVSAADITRTLLTDAHNVRDVLAAGNLSVSDRRRRDALRARLRGTAAADLIPGQLGAAWSRRQNALAAYRDALTGREPSIPALCASALVHMHANRLLNADPAVERVARALATDLLLRHAHDRQH